MDVQATEVCKIAGRIWEVHIVLVRTFQSCFLCVLSQLSKLLSVLLLLLSPTFILKFSTHICLSQFLFQYVQLNVINLQAANYRATVEYNAQQDSNWKSSETSWTWLQTKIGMVATQKWKAWPQDTSLASGPHLGRTIYQNTRTHFIDLARKVEVLSSYAG